MYGTKESLSGFGKKGKTFSEHFADYCGAKYAICVANGRDSLNLIVRAYGFGAGDEIIVPSNACRMTSSAVFENGCTPVLVEPDIHTYNIDPDKIEAAITPKTKAIVVAHLYGQAVRMKKVWELSMMYGLKVFEECSDASGALYQGIRVGNLAHAGSFSFDPDKGGAVTTNDEALYQKIKVLTNGESYGTVFAELDAKLTRLDADNARRREIAAYYRKNITNPKIILPETYDEDAAVWNVFAVRTRDSDRFRKYLADNGVYADDYPQSYSAAQTEPKACSYPVAEEIRRTVVFLPISSVLTDGEAKQAAEVVNAY